MDMPGLIIPVILILFGPLVPVGVAYGLFRARILNPIENDFEYFFNLIRYPLHNSFNVLSLERNAQLLQYFLIEGLPVPDLRCQ